MVDVDDRLSPRADSLHERNHRREGFGWNLAKQDARLAPHQNVFGLENQCEWNRRRRSLSERPAHTHAVARTATKPNVHASQRARDDCVLFDNGQLSLTEG